MKFKAMTYALLFGALFATGVNAQTVDETTAVVVESYTDPMTMITSTTKGFSFTSSYCAAPASGTVSVQISDIIDTNSTGYNPTFAAQVIGRLVSGKGMSKPGPTFQNIVVSGDGHTVTFDYTFDSNYKNAHLSVYLTNGGTLGVNLHQQACTAPPA